MGCGRLRLKFGGCLGEDIKAAGNSGPMVNELASESSLTAYGLPDGMAANERVSLPPSIGTAPILSSSSRLK